MQAIDKAAAKFGMPMGPITLNDLVGLATSVYAGKVVAAAYPDRAVGSPILVEMLQAGGAGKSAMRFYNTKGKGSKPEPNPAATAIIAKHRPGTKSMDEAEITDRLFLPMLLEATRVLEEGIVREPGDVDMGLILGIGFPPFRGGILRWADTVGAQVTRREARAVQAAGQAIRADREPAQAGQGRRDLLSAAQARRRVLIRYVTPSAQRRPTHEPGRDHRRRPHADRARRPTRVTIATSAPTTCRRRHPGAGEAHRDRPQGDRGRALGLRAAAGGAGVRHRAGSPR